MALSPFSNLRHPMKEIFYSGANPSFFVLFLSYLLPEPFAIKTGALLYFYFLHMTARTGNFVPPGWFF
jgi:hypothetical protein